jgi:hypothetical protein
MRVASTAKTQLWTLCNEAATGTHTAWAVQQYWAWRSHDKQVEHFGLNKSAPLLPSPLVLGAMVFVISRRLCMLGSKGPRRLGKTSR